MSDLRMYTDNTDTVIATSAEDALLVWAETHGDGYNDEHEGDWALNWSQIPDDKPVTLSYPAEDAATMTAAEWCAKDGRGFWGSTEF